MKKILVANQKGGVGKSMTADELAFWFERNGVPTAFLDLDSQGGTVHKTDRNPNAAVAVIDTPGALQPQLKDWIRDADVIVIPTKTTSRDIEPLQRMSKAVAGSGKPVVFVMNGWTRYRASRDFLEWFRTNLGEGMYVYKIPQSEQIIQAAAAGMSVVEYARRGPAVDAVKELGEAVCELAGINPRDYAR